MQLPPLILKEVREAKSPQEEESPDKEQKNRFTSYASAAAATNSKDNLSHRLGGETTATDDYCDLISGNKCTLF